MKYVIRLLIVGGILYGFKGFDKANLNGKKECAMAVKINSGISKIDFYRLGKRTTKTEWLGTYRSELGMTLKVKDQTLIDLTFEIQQGKGQCQESIRGKAVLTSANNANYNDKDNIVTIMLLKRSDGGIEVSETGFQHSPDCETFNGIYKPSN